MTAANTSPWLYNRRGNPGPDIRRMKFDAGATTPVKRGEVCDTSGAFVAPLGSNKVMAGIIVVANEEIKNGDRAGYYEVIVPQPGDVFEYALDVAAALAETTALYWSDSQTVTQTAGAGHQLATAVGQDNYPPKQGHLSDDGSGDSGTTIRSVAVAHLSFLAAVSYEAKLQV